jgi:hypothetical protein
MDCEKFESTLIDELYDELDELTSAAAKRHVAGCSRCASLLSGLKATRRVAVLPTVELPAGLEERILAAARDAQTVVPMKRRVARAISWAGSWSMRPQTAMAALFLLMIGSSALLLKGKASKMPASANLTVSEQGAPAPSAMTGTIARPADLESAEGAHGAAGPRAAGESYAIAPQTLSPVPPTATASATGFIANSNAFGDPAARPSYAPGLAGGSGGGAALDKSQGLQAPPSFKEADESATSDGDQANAPARRPASVVAPPAPKAQAPSGAPRQEAAEVQAQAQGQGQKKGGGPSDFESGLAQYKAGNYGEAARLFDNAAASGDLVAALYAARSVENQGGCSAAIGRYDQLATRAFGTTAGYDATLAAGHCFRLLGDYERARRSLVRLLTVTTHAARAQNELDALAPKAAAKPAARAAPPPAGTPPPAKASEVNQAF